MKKIMIAIMTTRRAFIAYGKTLMGGEVIWDKTPHSMHPVQSIEKARFA